MTKPHSQSELLTEKQSEYVLDHVPSVSAWLFGMVTAKSQKELNDAAEMAIIMINNIVDVCANTKAKPASKRSVRQPI